MATPDAAARLHEMLRERAAAGGWPAGGWPAGECCGGADEARLDESSAAAAGRQSEGAPICPEDREPCPSPLTAADVLAKLRSEAPLWTVEHAGRTLRGRTFGAGPPLYLLGGLTGTHELYALVAWVLREDFRTVMFDWPVSAGRIGNRLSAGRIGNPSCSARTRSIAAFAADVFAVADFHGDKRFAVFGTSFGGLAALAAMLERPERIERAVLHQAFAARRLSAFERLLVRVGRLLPGTLARVPFREAILRQNHRAWFPPFDAARFRFLLDDTGRAAIRDVAGRAMVVRRTDLGPRLGEVRQPVLLVRTRGEGAIAARVQDELAAGLPEVRSEWLHTSGQLPQLTHPHVLAKLLRTFLLPGVAGAGRAGTPPAGSGDPRPAALPTESTPQ